MNMKSIPINRTSITLQPHQVIDNRDGNLILLGTKYRRLKYESDKVLWISYLTCELLATKIGVFSHLTRETGKDYTFSIKWEGVTLISIRLSYLSEKSKCKLELESDSANYKAILAPHLVAEKVLPLLQDGFSAQFLQDNPLA